MSDATREEWDAAEKMLRRVAGAYGTLLRAECAEHGWKSRTRDPNSKYAGHYTVRNATVADAIQHLRKKHSADTVSSRSGGTDG